MTQKLISMDRRDFIKKATMAAAGAAVVSPMSAMLDSVTGERNYFRILCKFTISFKCI